MWRKQLGSADVDRQWWIGEGLRPPVVSPDRLPTHSVVHNVGAPRSRPRAAIKFGGNQWAVAGPVLPPLTETYIADALRRHPQALLRAGISGGVGEGAVVAKSYEQLVVVEAGGIRSLRGGAAVTDADIASLFAGAEVLRIGRDRTPGHVPGSGWVWEIRTVAALQSDGSEDSSVMARLRQELRAENPAYRMVPYLDSGMYELFRPLPDGQATREELTRLVQLDVGRALGRLSVSGLQLSVREHETRAQPAPADGSPVRPTTERLSFFEQRGEVTLLPAKRRLFRPRSGGGHPLGLVGRSMPLGNGGVRAKDLPVHSVLLWEDVVVEQGTGRLDIAYKASRTTWFLGGPHQMWNASSLERAVTQGHGAVLRAGEQGVPATGTVFATDVQGDRSHVVLVTDAGLLSTFRGGRRQVGSSALEQMFGRATVLRVGSDSPVGDAPGIVRPRADVRPQEPAEPPESRWAEPIAPRDWEWAAQVFLAAELQGTLPHDHREEAMAAAQQAASVGELVDVVRQYRHYGVHPLTVAWLEAASRMAAGAPAGEAPAARHVTPGAGHSIAGAPPNGKPPARFREVPPLPLEWRRG